MDESYPESRWFDENGECHEELEQHYYEHNMVLDTVRE